MVLFYPPNICKINKKEKKKKKEIQQEKRVDHFFKWFFVYLSVSKEDNLILNTQAFTIFQLDILDNIKYRLGSFLPEIVISVA